MTKNEADDIKRHFDMVAEGLRDEIRLVADRLSDAELSGRLTKIETSQASLQTRVERLEAKLAS